MFLQIGLHESQKEVTRAIWLKDNRQPILSNENIQEYRFWDHFKSFSSRSNNRNPLERYEPVHEISNNVICATSKASNQPAQTRSLIRAFASRLSIL